MPMPAQIHPAMSAQSSATHSRLRPLLLLMLLCVCQLCACERQGTVAPGAAASAVASPPVSSAAPASLASTGSASGVASADALSAQQGALLQAALGPAWNPKTGLGLIQIKGALNSGAVEFYQMEFRQLVTLQNGVHVLALNGVYADANGNLLNGHSVPGMLSLYWLQQQNGRWQLLRKRENLLLRGEFGNSGEYSVSQTADGKSMLALNSLSAGMGREYHYLDLILLDQDGAQVLTPEQSIDLSLDKEFSELDGQEWKIHGSWQLQAVAGQRYPDLVMDYKGEGKIYPDRDEDDERVGDPKIKPGNARVVYRHNGKGYQLYSGSNPIPSDFK